MTRWTRSTTRSQPRSVADLDGFIERLATLPLKFEPGERWHYSVATDVLGAVVERASGQAFDAFLRERIFGPLDMHDTFFNVPEDKLSRLLPNHRWDKEEGKLVTFGDRSKGAENETMPSGGGGLVSTARDYMRFAEMLRSGGELDGVRILRPETMGLMIENHLPATLSGGGQGETPTDRHKKDVPGFGFGLGFGLVTGLQDGDVGSVGEYSWGGAAGTIFWIDSRGGDRRHRDDPALRLAVAASRKAQGPDVRVDHREQVSRIGRRYAQLGMTFLENRSRES